MKPMQDYMSIQKLDQKAKAGIIIPDTVKDKPDREADLFLVIDIGAGHHELGKLIVPTVKKGDIVFIMGPSLVCLKDNKRYQFARSRDVVAIF